MILQMVWPRCDFQNGSWGNEPIDSFWVECTPDEAERLIIPRLSPMQQERVKELRLRYADDSPNIFALIAKDLSSIQPMEPHYPYGNLWNAYSPFRAIMPVEIRDLEELRDLDVVDLMVGPQSPGDQPFTERMRFHQSWYRANRLDALYGAGPTERSGQPYGNMLHPEAAAQGLNFLHPTIFKVAEERIKQKARGVEPFRLLHNMLASQPMCFNLFGLFVDEPQEATPFVRALLPDEVERVTCIEIEYAPRPARDYLGDRTALDAFVEYIRPDGGLAFAGIETKLTEPFSPSQPKRERYCELTQQPNSPWLPDAWPAVSNIAHNQLWRDQLLVHAMLQHPGSPYAHGRLLLVRHPEDERCSDVVASYRTLLRPDDDTFIDLPLDRLVVAWTSAAPDGQDTWQAWLRAFEERYLQLEASEGDWQRWKARTAG